MAVRPPRALRTLGPRRRLLLWLLGLALAIPAILLLDPRAGMEELLPEGDRKLDRLVMFFEERLASQIIAIEVESPPEQAAVRDRWLQRAVERLAELGARPAHNPDDAGSAARVAETVWNALPQLSDESVIDALALQIEPAALDLQLERWREILSSPGGEWYASLAYRDVLGVTPRFLAVQQQQAVAAGVARAGLVQHEGGRHALALLSVDFAPNEASRSAVLMAAIRDLQAEAAGDGVHLEAHGSYRHFDDNYRQLVNDLFLTLPLSIVLVAVFLLVVVGDWRSFLALHLPPILAIAGGIAVLVIWRQGDVPLMVLGFGAGVIGIGVDYGIHMVRARQDGRPDAVRRPLVISYLTTASAFVILLAAGVPILRDLGIFVAAGLGLALLCTIHCLPGVVRPRAVDRLAVLSRPLLRFSETRPWRKALIGLVLVAAMVPGVWQLRLVDDPRALDGSSIDTIEALEDFSGRWGVLGSSNFLVSDGNSLDEALQAAAGTRARIGLPPSHLERLLPSRAIQAERIDNWQRFWNENGTRFAENLQTVCAQLGLRHEAFAASIEHYLRQDWVADLSPETWQGTPLAAGLDQLISTRADGRAQVLSPIQPSTPDDMIELGETVAATSAAAHGDDRVWLAARILLGRQLVSAIGQELLAMGGVILLAMLTVLSLLLRKPRAVLAVAIPPLAALTWSFGMLGYMGVALMPMHVLVATFVAGIGIDDAIFLGDGEQRSHALSPVLATTITSVAGVGAMALAGHPMVSAMGQSLLIGMTSCLIACLLFCPFLAPKADHQLS